MALGRLVAPGLCLAMTAGTPLPAPAQAPGDSRPPSTLVLPAKDPGLQRGLRNVLAEPAFRRIVGQKRLSVALVDLSNPGVIRYAGFDDDHMRYAASLPKIAILLGVFDQIAKGRVAYTPALRGQMEAMIRRSSNIEATNLIELIGFEAIASTLRDPRYELYSPARKGGLWVGKDYGGLLGYWRRDPLHQISHGATARQVARFFVMLDRGSLVSPWASTEMKDIMSQPELHHKFVEGLDARPNSIIYRKSGTWKNWHADAALVERDGKRYVAVALAESFFAGSILSKLIVRLDDLIPTPPPSRTAAAR